jgi:hypothetical protein
MANKKVSQLVSKPSVLVTDLFPIADPTTGQLFKTTISDLGTAIGSGVSSVNTLVGAVVLDTDDIQELASPTNRWFTDTRARAALSASSPLAYNSGTGVFSIPAATSSQNGYLTSTDWTTFNAKQAALSGTGFVKISGTTISYDNSTYLTTSAAASTYLALAGGTLTGALNGTSATFTGDLTISSGNPRLYFTDTNNNPDYFISNTDGTFTVYDVTNSTSRFTIGTTGNATFTNAITGGGSITGESIYSNGIVSVGTGLTVGTTISATGSITGASIIRSGGTSSQFLKADGSVDSTAYLPLGGGTLTGALFATSASFSGFVGFGGNTSPLAAIDVTGAGIFSSSVRSSGYYLTGMTSGSGALYYNSGANRVTVANYNASGIVTFEVNGGSTALTLNSNLSATFAAGGTFAGSVHIGGNSPVLRLDVSGNASDTTTVGGATVEQVTIFRPSNGVGGIRSGFNTTSGDAYIWSANSGSSLLLGVRSAPNNNVALTLASTGAATFSSSVTAGSGGTVKPQFIANGGSSLGAGMLFNTGLSGTDRRNWFVGTEENVAGDFVIKSSTAAGGNAQSGDTRIQILNNGNVGIGTTAPSTKFVVSNAGAGGIEMQGNSSVSGGAFLQTYNRSTNAFFDFDIVANNMIFRTGQSYAEAMRITSGGNVVYNKSLVSNAQVNSGDFTLDTSGTTISLGPLGAVNIGSFSGMVLVTNTGNGVTMLFLCGGGFGTLVSQSTAGATGTMTNFAGSGYTFTTAFTSTTSYSFQLFRTRVIA